MTSPHREETWLLREAEDAKAGDEDASFRQLVREESLVLMEQSRDFFLSSLNEALKQDEWTLGFQAHVAKTNLIFNMQGSTIGGPFIRFEGETCRERSHHKIYHEWVSRDIPLHKESLAEEAARIAFNSSLKRQVKEELRQGWALRNFPDSWEAHMVYAAMRRMAPEGTHFENVDLAPFEIAVAPKITVLFPDSPSKEEAHRRIRRVVMQLDVPSQDSALHLFGILPDLGVENVS